MFEQRSSQALQVPAHQAFEEQHYPVSYWASLTAGMAAGCEEVSVPAFFSGEQEIINNKAKDRYAVRKISLGTREVSDWS